MMLDLRAATIAANRFGFGAKPGELSAIAPDPRGWLTAQLKPDPSAVAGTPSAKQLAALFQVRREHKAEPDVVKAFEKILREDFRTAVVQRTLAAAANETPFRE